MDRKSEDLRLWQQWRRTQSSADLQALLTQLQPVINQQVNRWSGTLARDTLETQAKILAVGAIKGFNPDAGTALATHVTNQLQKLSRTVYTHSQAARLPEHKVIGMVSFHAAQEHLKGELGHDPSTAELADHMGWGNERVQEFQRAYGRKEMLGSGEFNPATFPVADQHDPIVSFVYHDMAPPQQRLFEHITGFGGKEPLSNQEIMKRHKLTQGQLSYQKRKLIDLFNQAQGRLPALKGGEDE
jgi:hypothetical protein